MVKRNYSVTLEEEVVEEAKKNMQVGQKLSPVLNDLLIKWNEEKKEPPKKKDSDLGVLGTLGESVSDLL